MKTPTLPSLSLVALLALSTSALAHSPGGKDRKNPGPGVRSLEVCESNGALHLLLGEFTPENESPVISHRVSTDGGNSWSTPVTVNTNVPPPHGLHRGVDARIAVHGNNLVAAWTSTGSDKWGSGPIITVRSEDGGKTWTQGPNPADDGLTDGHNYLALGADSSGRFHIAWLDARDGERGLRYSVSSDAGLHWASNSTPAPKTCECCWNALTPLNNGGIAVLYRARAPRDMFVITSPNAGAKWNTPVPVGDFKWEINMCPHVGGALTTCAGPNGERLHATVWTGASGQSGLYHLRSDDSGVTWSAPHKMNVPMSWHPHIAADAKGRVAAVWDTMTASTPVVWSSISKDAGETWSQPVQLSPEGVPAGFPRVVPAGDGFRVFWTSELPEKAATWSSVVLQP
ncbi:MAG: sialidase family protein [Verrucomicrobiota bacterium]